MLLEAWELVQQHQHHPGICQNENLGNSSQTYWVRSSGGGSQQSMWQPHRQFVVKFKDCASPSCLCLPLQNYLERQRRPIALSYSEATPSLTTSYPCLQLSYTALCLCVFLSPFSKHSLNAFDGRDAVLEVINVNAQTELLYVQREWQWCYNNPHRKPSWFSHEHI